MIDLFNVVWGREVVPGGWKEGLIFPIFKEGDVEDPGNFRGISLLSVVGKLFGRVLNSRLMKFAEDNGVWGQEHPERVFVLHTLLTKRMLEKKRTVCAFIDLKKAYDRVWRNGLWKQMWMKGMRGKSWRLVREVYRGVKSAVLVGGGELGLLKRWEWE